VIRLAPRYGRIAATLILLMALAVPVTLALSAIDLYRSNLDGIAERRSAIARLEAIAAYGTRLDGDRAGVAEITHAAWFLEGSDAAIAAAALQAKLKELAQAHGVEVAQAHDLKPRVLSGVTYVGVRLATSGLAQGVEPFLRAIEASLPLLIVDDVELRAEISGVDARYEPVTLYVDLTVWGALAGVPPASGQADGGT
jgi:hypothetical protein